MAVGICDLKRVRAGGERHAGQLHRPADCQVRESVGSGPRTDRRRDQQYECPDAVEPAALATVLRSWPSVEAAYVDRIPVAPQGSLGFEMAAPTGIDAVYAQTLPGGAGQGQCFVDLELGWTLNHDALATHAIPAPLFGVIEDAERLHGTSVLGIVCGSDPNAIAAGAAGFVGIAPKVQSVRVVSYKSSGGALPAASTIADAIATAVDNLQFGDVLLLETQMPDFTPCETDLSCFDAIRLASALGVVVIEPAGNGAAGAI